ncbi:MAG: helix-turn-helix domain-containing protein [Pseudonocardiales bacterium]
MPGPTIRRCQLGIELKRLRDAAGVVRPDAAAGIGCSPAKIAHFESGRNTPSKTELIVLLRDHYGADKETLDALEELRKEASQRGWWSTYGLPEWLARSVGLEFDATSVRSLELEVIPGLLQTEEYARMVHSLRGRLTDKERDRRVAVRMKRQAKLLGPNPLKLQAVISEAALLRCARQADLGLAQLQRLTERAQQPNIELRVLPFDLGLHAGMSGLFSLFSFPDELIPDTAYQEYVVGGHIIDEQSAVAQLARLFDELRNQALGVNESLAMVAEFIDQAR